MVALALLAVALASGYGASPAMTAPGSGGGLVIPGPPKIGDVICLTGCTGLRTGSVGGKIQVSGTGMSNATAVSFAGESGRVRSKPDGRSRTSVVVTVPRGAKTGRLKVIGTGGSSSAPSGVELTVGPSPKENPNSDSLVLADVSVAPDRVYLYGDRDPAIEFVLAGGNADQDLRVDVVNGQGTVIASRFRDGVASNSSVRIAWNGKASDGSNARSGSYRFVVRMAGGERIPPDPARKRGGTGFRIYGFMFPVRGGHSYGDGIGAGRGHQGQDVSASCGTPLVAARGGKVYYNDYQASGAGNYVVINLAGTRKESHVYMHLERPSPAKVGSFVKTGQRIGTVGTTGRSTGCHLHFEHWSSPGWYQGGSFLDPSSEIRQWDTYS